MAIRKRMHGSAASLITLSAVAVTAPAFAQSNDPAQDYAAARAQYEAQLQDYNQKQRAYEQQRGDYNARLDSYRRGLNEPPRAPDTVVVVDDPDPDVVVVDPDGDTAVIVDNVPDEPIVVARPADDFAARLFIRDVPVPLVRLEDMVDPNNELFNAPVLDSAGLTVGHFRRIEFQQDGDVVAVVTLRGSRRTISLLTEHVRADPDRRTLIADLTARQIDRIPSGFPYG